MQNSRQSLHAFAVQGGDPQGFPGSAEEPHRSVTTGRPASREWRHHASPEGGANASAQRPLAWRLLRYACR